ncbi:MAG: VIT1/CCC1 transporter family protein [Caldilineaceae bacterium]
MPATTHVEHHFSASATVRDIVIGMSDGLTVPFALAAGLSGAVAQTNLVVAAGLAEIAAGSIAMGLGGYLAARSDEEHYEAERRREQQEIENMPDVEEAEVAAVFRDFGLAAEHVQAVTDAICSDRQRWINFMMNFELGLEKPDPRRAARSALTIALAYIGGGLIPLSPYMIVTQLITALYISIAVTLAALFVFGYVKGHFTGAGPLRSGLQTLLVGGLAAAAAFTLARLFG